MKSQPQGGTISVQSATRLLLNFDLNGTLILKDTSKGADDDYMLISSLAEATISKWDGEHEMSFKEYVYSKLLPGDKSNAQLKKRKGEGHRNIP